MRLIHSLAATSLLLLTAGSAHAALVPIDPGTFTQTGPTITFGEASADLTTNPSYPLLPGLVANFGAYFNGQVLNALDPDTGYPYLTGSPAGLLTLASDPGANALITTDALNPDPSNEVLAGAAPFPFGGPLAVLFSTPVQQVSFVAGMFGEAGDLLVEAFLNDGTSLGTVSNTVSGFESFALADSGNALISGLSFYLPDQGTSGFEIDNLAVSVAALAPPPVPPSVPEPGTIGLLGLGTLALVVTGRRRTLSLAAAAAR